MAMSAHDKQFTRNAGSPEQIRENLIKFTRDVALLAQKRPELTEQYPDKWVAFYSGEVILISDTLDKLLEGVDQKGIEREKVVTQFLSSEKITMIL